MCVTYRLQSYSLSCRYKSFSRRTGKQCDVLWFYFEKSLKVVLMSCSISMYLFHILVHLGFRQVLEELSWLFCSMKPLFDVSDNSYSWLWFKYSHLTIGIQSPNPLLFVLELAYSHNVMLQLFLGFMEINPIFLLVSLCISLVFGVSSFYYEYSLSYKISMTYRLLHFKR